MSEAAVSTRLDALLQQPDLAALLACLSQNGHETRIVGGAIRNALLGVDASDVDLATTMMPEAVMEATQAARFHPVPTGLAHGTVTVIVAGRAFEVTTLREDLATDGRHADVRFGTDFTRDAARRDFTINAMSMGADGVLHDPFGGVSDLAASHVRFIGDADQRLREDYLRALRFLRFSAQYGQGVLDQDGWQAVLRQRAGILQLSRERIRQEMLKWLMAPFAIPVFAAADAASLFQEIVGRPVFLNAFIQRLALAQRQNEEIVPLFARLFAFFIKDEADIAHHRDALRLTKTEDSQMRAMLAAGQVLQAGGQWAFFTIADQYPTVAAEALRVEAIRLGTDEILTHMAEVEHPPLFLLTGKDVVALGVAPGPDVGALLKDAKQLWIEAGFAPDIEAQKAILAQAIQQSRG